MVLSGCLHTSKTMCFQHQNRTKNGWHNTKDTALNNFRHFCYFCGTKKNEQLWEEREYDCRSRWNCFFLVKKPLHYGRGLGLVFYFNVSIANCIRFSVSSLPRNAANSYMSGPCPAPTRQIRHAFQGRRPDVSTHGSTTAFIPSTLKS